MASQEARLARWATQLERLGLQWPALFVLDVARPVRYMLTQVCWVAQPWLGEEAVALAWLFEDEAALISLRERLRAGVEEE